VTTEAAHALLDRVASDKAFSAELAGLGGGVPPEAMARIRAEGFDVTEDEVREAYLERYGDQLTPEQVEKVAAGVDMSGLWGGLGSSDYNEGEPV
jgi:predicted ribosomally synthesized peptide with nif11-like leader